MAAPKGHPRYGGRAVGTPNKSTNDIRKLAQVHGPAVIQRLLELSGCMVDAMGIRQQGADSHATQVMAMKELLDRGYGRSTQLIAGDANEPPIRMTFGWDGPPANAVLAPVLIEDATDD